MTGTTAPTVLSVGEDGGHGWRVLGILCLLMGFASISTDIYLPGMPTMSHALGADMGTAEWTVSGYLIGFALGQLFWGPVGDRFGRRLPVATGIALFVLGSAGCAMATGIWWVIAARVVQAAGASAGVVLGRAMVRDLYQGPRAASMMSTLMTVMAIAPLIGPLVGGQVLLVMGWRAIFWVLVGVGMVTLALLTTLPETLPPKRRHRIAQARLSPATSPCCAIAAPWPISGRVPSSTAGCSPMSRVRPSLTSPITVCRRSITGCCSGWASSVSWVRT
ncbi:MFS transporter [Novosphingobium sp. ST904]|uniref:MFS transporter n=1 Tax=Novosphingobium sp. ST904 TaxID=1684385 RepID=UPI000ADBF6E1|nr:MFS transporter [Novosphingobium sp. ST904]